MSSGLSAFLNKSTNVSPHSCPSGCGKRKKGASVRILSKICASYHLFPGYTTAISFVPRKLGIVTRIFPSPSNTGATGDVSLLSEEDGDRLRKKDMGFFLFFWAAGAFLSGRTSVHFLPSWNRGIVCRDDWIFGFASYYFCSVFWKGTSCLFKYVNCQSTKQGDLVYVLFGIWLCP